MPRFIRPTSPSDGLASETATPPWRRHPVRLALGRRYYIVRRHLKWLLGSEKWARVRGAALPHVQFSHASPLMRPLGGVDLQMQRNKVTNLGLACAKLNGIRLEPGETLSYWRLVGPTSARKGYLPGLVLKYGQVTSGTGGGLCQLSNLIYWLTLHTPLQVTERHRHGYDVFPDAGRTQPFGSGATCFYNYGDLMIRNQTDRPFQLHLWLSETHLHGEWLSDRPADRLYEVYEAEHIFRQELWGGYSRHNLLFRHVRGLDGQDYGDEYVAENHALVMYSPLLPGPTRRPN
ncbi:MAG: VanW family protein [Micrococcales bacterium]|nr:VanW family protein [Micrococcales bacterium]